MSFSNNGTIHKIARLGLTSKGIVYCILGILAFMAAFEIGGQSNENVGVNGILKFIYDQTGGKILLSLLALGFLCYSSWRIIQAFSKDNSSDEMGWGKRLRYFWSGLLYLSLTGVAIKILLHKSDGGGSKSQKNMLSDFLQESWGQWAVGLLAVAIAIAGIYQLYYGLSEKYKKHVSKLSISSGSSLLLVSGKIGYTARGIVWLIIAWLLLKAAFHSNANEAGDTTDAFKFLENSSYGSYLLGAVSLGFICYGIFNFIRARYESFR